MLTKSLESASQIPTSGPRKAAIQLVAEFETALLAHHREGKDVFGPERDLAQNYHASPKAVRQALRILESRFLGSVRRGVHGGLALRVPDMEESAELMAIYLSAIGSGRDEVLGAQKLLLPEMAHRPDASQNFAQSILAALTQTFDRANSHLPARGDTRALIIARRIVADLQARPVASGGRAKLGKLTELEEIHSSGRPIILQAIRILEELEMIEMVPGRGGGIALRQPSPGAVVRALYPHFVLQNLSMETSRDIIWSINLATAAYAATHRSSRQAADLRATLDGLTARDFDTADHSGQVLIWRMLGDVAGNKVLHMLARCIFYFQLQSDAVALERILEPLPEVLLDYTCQLAEAVCDGDVIGARGAVVRSESVARS